ncbi:MAG: hypothetical protein JWO58_3225 [Chitinophagaceae bacterium]|nr:hypothetical protein [Chitinophagaceae bacterium]
MAQFYKVKKKYVQRAGIAMGIVLIGISLVINGLRVNDYKITITKMRNQKDEYFKESENSPITDQEIFRGLLYYDIQPKYKVTAKLKFIDSLSIIKVLRNDGKLTEYSRFAVASFLMDTIEHTVILLKLLNEEEGKLFLPFTDMTNGRQTYRAGRYLDINWKKGQKTTDIDFNLAYNPYCVYNYKYSCPIPPRENFIKAFIEAGEKMIPEQE